MEDPNFEIFYTKNVILNEGIRAWIEVLPRGNLL